MARKTKDAESKGPGVFGRNLLLLRRRKEWSRERLAEKSHVAVATISNIELGYVQTPASDTAEGLAEALGVDVSTLWRDATPDPRDVVQVTPVSAPADRIPLARFLEVAADELGKLDRQDLGEFDTFVDRRGLTLAGWWALVDKLRARRRGAPIGGGSGAGGTDGDQGPKRSGA